MDSPAPVIFKRPKAKSAQRIRQASPDLNAQKLEQEVPDDSPSMVAAKLKTKVKRAKPKPVLSFGGTEEEEGGGEVFQVKKSNLSRKLALGTHPASVPLNLEQATISRPTYDQAYLNELKASTPSSRPPPVGEYDADITMDVDQVASMDVDGADLITEAVIPSESSIKVARERRKRIQKTGVSGEEDYISLSLVRQSDEPQGPHPESRLVREEDELGEGDDEFAEYTSAQERIALGKKSRKLEASKRRDAMKEMIADAQEEDEEMAEWEEKQLRRGGHAMSQATMPKPKEVYKPAPIPAAAPIPTLDPAMARLSEQLNLLTLSHAKNTTAIDSLAKERAEIDDREKEMREMVGRAEDKRAWFESFKDWLEGVAGFLDEKYPLLEKLEEEHVSLLQERFEMITSRRRAEDEGDLSNIFGDLPSPPPAELEAEEVDELGRTIPKPSPVALKRERRDARTRRRQRRLQEKRKAVEAEEGYSTDAELPSHDQSAYADALKALAVRKKDVLADVRAEEFLDPGKGRWGAWRERYSESYVGAWGGFGVVSVWEFWVRLEMVGWDCIADSRSLDSFKWYQGLYVYSRPGDGEMGENPLGPDGDLVASMISTAVIPRLSVLMAGGALDPYSEVHIKRAIDLVEEVEATVAEGNAKLQVLIKSIMTSFQTAITDTEAVLAKFKAAQIRPPTFDPEAIPARRRFLARRIKLLRNLLRWRKHTGEHDGLGALAKRLVGNCFIDVARSGWEVGGEELARTACNILPGDLIPYQLKGWLDIR